MYERFDVTDNKLILVGLLTTLSKSADSVGELEGPSLVVGKVNMPFKNTRLVNEY